ncbi:hypothetical protein PoB_003480800 [Plakobranchus ocellatus]|uniref:Uncharacterized protein n=1 Tax=Plakobranchus ocellatus TaxID=259542 RepID=A0AAV4ALW9_9GAST|nr:hypothetical protein PoB_003480800 [Plakobranchus ocellatus]
MAKRGTGPDQSIIIFNIKKQEMKRSAGHNLSECPQCVAGEGHCSETMPHWTIILAPLTLRCAKLIQPLTMIVSRTKNPAEILKEAQMNRKIKSYAAQPDVRPGGDIDDHGPPFHPVISQMDKPVIGHLLLLDINLRNHG